MSTSNSNITSGNRRFRWNDEARRRFSRKNKNAINIYIVRFPRGNFLSMKFKILLCPALAEHTVFVVSVRNESRRVRSQRKSVDWGTMGPALGGAYECYAHISSSACDSVY